MGIAWGGAVNLEYRVHTPSCTIRGLAAHLMRYPPFLPTCINSGDNPASKKEPLMPKGMFVSLRIGFAAWLVIGTAITARPVHYHR